MSTNVQLNRAASSSDLVLPTARPDLGIPRESEHEDFSRLEVPTLETSLVSSVQPEQRREIHPRIQQFFTDHTADLRRYGTTENLDALKSSLSRALNLPPGVDPNSIRIAYDRGTNNALRNDRIIGEFSLPGEPPRQVLFALNTNGEINLNGFVIDRDAVPASLARLQRGIAAVLPQEATISSLRQLSRTHGGSFEVTELNHDRVRLFFVRTLGKQMSSRNTAVFAAAPRAGIPGGEGESLRRLTMAGEPQTWRNGNFELVANYDVPGSPSRRIVFTHEAQRINNPNESWHYTIQAGTAVGGQNLGSGRLTVAPPSNP